MNTQNTAHFAKSHAGVRRNNAANSGRREIVSSHNGRTFERKFDRSAAKAESLVRVSHDGVLKQLKPVPQVAAAPRVDPVLGTLPDGYEIIDAEGYVITPRDLVFMGGARSSWMPARRAGETGEMVRFSTAQAVARPRMRP